MSDMGEWRPVPMRDGQVRYGCSCCCWFPLLAFLAVIAGIIVATLLA